MIWFETDNLI